MGTEVQRIKDSLKHKIYTVPTHRSEVQILLCPKKFLKKFLGIQRLKISGTSGNLKSSKGVTFEVI